MTTLLFDDQRTEMEDVLRHSLTEIMHSDDYRSGRDWALKLATRLNAAISLLASNA